MKKQLSKAKELKGEFIEEKSRIEKKLNSNKKAFKQGVAFDARVNGNLPEAEVKSLSNGKEQVKKLKQEKKKNKVLRFGLYGTLIGLITLGGVYLGIDKFKKVPNVNDNGIDSSEVNHIDDDIHNNTQNSTGTVNGSNSNSNGNKKRNTKINDAISDKSDVRDTIDKNNYKITGNQSTTITVDEDNEDTKQKIDEANKKGDKVEEIGDGITVIIDNQPKKDNNTTPTTPSTPDTNTPAPTNPGTTAPSTIDPTNAIDVPSAESGIGEGELNTNVQTNEPVKEAGDDLLDQFLER